MSKFSKRKRQGAVVQTQASKNSDGNACISIDASISACSVYERELTKLIYPAPNQVHTLPKYHPPPASSASIQPSGPLSKVQGDVRIKKRSIPTRITEEDDRARIKAEEEAEKATPVVQNAS